MPIYEYECPDHGRFDALQSMMAEHKATCPECGKPAERRFSITNHRQANPLKVIDHTGRVLATNPDVGIRPGEGEAYPVGG